MISIIGLILNILPVISILLSLVCFYIYYRLYVVMSANIKRAFAILGEKSGVSKRAAIQDEKIDKAVHDIVEGMAMNNPTVQLAMNIIDEYTDLEITPETILALINHPTIKKILENFQLGSELKPHGETGYGASRYQLKK